MRKTQYRPYPKTFRPFHPKPFPSQKSQIGKRNLLANPRSPGSKGFCLQPIYNRDNRESFSFFAPRVGKMRLHGVSMCPCAKHVANWVGGGVLRHAPAGNFGFGPLIMRNLVESWTVFAQTCFTISCIIKDSIIDLHVKLNSQHISFHPPFFPEKITRTLTHIHHREL